MLAIGADVAAWLPSWKGLPCLSHAFIFYVMKVCPNKNVITLRIFIQFSHGLVFIKPLGCNYDTGRFYNFIFPIYVIFPMRCLSFNAVLVIVTVGYTKYRKGCSLCVDSSLRARRDPPKMAAMLHPASARN